MKLPGGFICEYEDPEALYVAHEIFYLRAYESLCCRRTCKRVVLDCGAYVGLFALYAICNGYDKVIALEPNISSFSQLAVNIKLNNLLSKVTAINKAAYSTSGRADLLIDGAWSSIRTGSESSLDAFTSSVSTITLDELSTALCLRFDVIKIDVEGSEHEVLKGADETLRNVMLL